MRGKKADGMLAGDGLKWDYGRKRPAPPSLSSRGLGKSTTSISDAQKGHATTIGKITTNPQGKIYAKTKSPYGPWQFRHFGSGSLSQLGKKIYRDGHK